jgi:hypothetical protein
MQLLGKSFQVVQPQQSRHNVQLPFLLTFYSDLVAGRTGDPALVLTAMVFSLIELAPHDEVYR